jgi:outer membrane receptor for Fe3+-dicitrate
MTPLPAGGPNITEMRRQPQRGQRRRSASGPAGNPGPGAHQGFEIQLAPEAAVAAAFHALATVVQTAHIYISKTLSVTYCSGLAREERYFAKLM